MGMCTPYIYRYMYICVVYAYPCSCSGVVRRFSRRPLSRPTRGGLKTASVQALEGAYAKIAAPAMSIRLTDAKKDRKGKLSKIYEGVLDPCRKLKKVARRAKD